MHFICPKIHVISNITNEIGQMHLIYPKIHVISNIISNNYIYFQNYTYYSSITPIKYEYV